MKILLFTGYLNRKLNANNKIASEIAAVLAYKGHDVTICGMSDFDNYTTIYENSVKAVYYKGDDFISIAKSKLEKYILSSGLPRAQAVKNFSIRHPFSALAIHFSYTSQYKDTAILKQGIKVIENLYKCNKYDVIIAFQMPFWAEKAVIEADIPYCKKAIYQLDPWGMHEMVGISSESIQQRIENEVSCFCKSDYIFTTATLLKQYKKHERYKPYTDKIYELDFPNIKPVLVDEKNPLIFEKEYTNILFAGMVDDGYRNPEFFLKNIENIILSGTKLRVYFLGNNLSETLNKYIKKYPENIFSMDAVTPGKAFAALNECDFLLNISNNISNMVPSKIFDYFSFGKPIINIQKIENCPAQEYMEKYPLCFNMNEFENLDYSEALLNFIEANKDKRIEFEKIKEIYKTATPEYVADKIIEVISSL